MSDDARIKRAMILDAVARIPPGRVASYGQVAAAAGMPGRARLVGRTLAGLRGESSLPWFRVIGASGRISFAPGTPAHALQRELLEAEGVRFGGERVDWSRCRWNEGLGE